MKGRWDREIVKGWKEEGGKEQKGRGRESERKKKGEERGTKEGTKSELEVHTVRFL